MCNINEELFSLLGKIDKENGSINFEIIDSDDVWESLVKNKIITNNVQDDLLSCISAIHQMRRLNNILNLTITPTMDCNFYCPYCFEDKMKGAMDTKIMDRIIRFVKKQDRSINHVNLTWFGGEPLLAPNVLEYISKKINVPNKYNYYARIITNGYYLNPENVKILENCNVSHIQLSMDGIYESHNKKRFTKTDKDTFSTIINNIDLFHKSNSLMDLSIRINIGKDNVSDFYKIDNFFKDRYSVDKRISIHYAFIVDTTKRKNEASINDSNKRLSLLKKIAIQQDNINKLYPSNFINECAVRNNHSWAFDAVGDVYKCWEIMGNKKYKVGELTDKGIKITNPVMLNRYLYGADHLQDAKCLDCLSLPICSGGCPHKRLENEFEGENFSVSACCDNEIDKYLMERIKIYDNELNK